MRTGSRHEVRCTVNGSTVVREVEPATLLIDLLRSDLGLTGSHIGCETSSCGACTVIVDGLVVKSCAMLALQAHGAAVLTVESLGASGELHPVAEAFLATRAFQCGYCTPGMLMSSVALLAESDRPSETEIREALSGNLCRCTGYDNIIRAVQWAAEVMGGGDPGPAHAGDSMSDGSHASRGG